LTLIINLNTFLKVRYNFLANKKRYDFIYINKDKFEIEDINYLFEEAINAGSDHALVLCDLKEKL